MVEKVWVKRSGYCKSIEGIVIKGGSLGKTLCFPALWGLIKNQKGYILFDTGYSSFFEEMTSKFPEILYKKLLSVKLIKEEYPNKQLQQMGIMEDEIKYVIVSHFHPDHIGGLRHFSKSKLVYSKKNLKLLGTKGEKGGFSPLFFKDLVPQDILERSIWIEDLDRIYIKELYPFKDCYDLFLDGSMIIVSLEGHANGQIGLYIKDVRGKTWFFVSDACWHENDYINESCLGGIRRFITDDYGLFLENVANIKNFHKTNPETVIIPSHCKETFERIKQT